MHKDELRQALLELRKSQGWNYLLREWENQKEKSLQCLLAGGRSEDRTNGYWAGYYDGMNKFVNILDEELDRLEESK